MYVVRNLSDPTLFWSNVWGWGSREGCELFDANERFAYATPNGGEWVLAKDV